MDKKEIIEIMERFLNELGIWVEFEDWLEEQGYKPEELGFPKDE